VDKEEILQYLQEKRNATAGVAMLQQKLQEAQMRVEVAEKKFRKTIIALWVLAIGTVLGMAGEGNHILLAIVLFSIAILLMVHKHKHYTMPAEQVKEQIQADLQNEMASSAYQTGRQGFPEKFYNYADILRLWQLVDENRARDLQEAFNILETQQYRENKLSMQEEIKGLQQDIAQSSRLTAISSTFSAYKLNELNGLYKGQIKEAERRRSGRW
jgi:hypothetical protein